MARRQGSQHPPPLFTFTYAQVAREPAVARGGGGGCRPGPIPRAACREVPRPLNGRCDTPYKPRGRLLHAGVAGTSPGVPFEIPAGILPGGRVALYPPECAG